MAALTLLSSGAPTSANSEQAGPSFDCARANTPFEAAICHDPALARLDVELDGLYRALPPTDPARRAHRVWSGLRRDCGSDPVCIFDLQMRSYFWMHGSQDWPTWLRDAAKTHRRPSRLAAGGGDLGWGRHLPQTVGFCQTTTIEVVSDRFGGDPKSADAAGTAALLGDGAYVVTYSSDATLIASRPGDPIRLCLASLPTGCPPGDERGREYNITNLRTHGHTCLPDSQHECGGA